MPFLFFLSFLWHLWWFRVHNCFSSYLVISMGNFLRVVSRILPAMFFEICSHISSFWKSDSSGDFDHAKTGSGAKK